MDSDMFFVDGCCLVADTVSFIIVSIYENLLLIGHLVESYPFIILRKFSPKAPSPVWILEAIPWCGSSYAIMPPRVQHIPRILKWRVTRIPTDDEVNEYVFRRHEGLEPIAVLTATSD